MHILYHNVIIAQGKSNYYLWSNITQIATQLAVFFLFYQQGIFAVVCAYSFLNILWLFVWQGIAGNMIGLRLPDMLKDIVPFMLAALLVMFVAYLATSSLENLILSLLLRIMIAAVVYVALLKLLHAKILEECILFVRRKG